MRKVRLFCPDRLAAQALIRLDEDQARHLLSVLRLEAGHPIALFNGEDGEWTGALALEGKRGAAVRLEAQTRAPAPIEGPWLLFAPVKRQATDWIIEKATELGATRISPVITRRTMAETVRLDRWQAIAKEAAAQCERLDLPILDPPRPLDAALAAWPAGVALIMADEAGGAPILSALPAAGPARLALLVGPEGGFDPAERAWLQTLSFVHSVSFGATILRAETACVAGLATIQAWRGTQQA